MITTRTRHHETLVLILPALGSAATWAICYIKHKTETTHEEPDPTTQDTDPQPQ